MRKLVIPPSLKTEFATVEALWASNAETRRVDALLLAWVKHEKQLRRLFCFLVFQHPSFEKTEIDRIISVLADRYDITPEVFRTGIDRLGVATIEEVIGESFKEHCMRMEEVRKIRNKLMHGQLTGRKIQSRELEMEVDHVIRWIADLADGAKRVFGYDGVARSTFFLAKRTSGGAVKKFPFQTVDELQRWLENLIKELKKARTARTK